MFKNGAGSLICENYGLFTKKAGLKTASQH